MSPEPRSIAAAIARLGPGGVRIAQLIALRRDLFAPTIADALALRRPAERMPPATARAVVADELGTRQAASITQWIAVAEDDPLRWTAQGFDGGREMRVSITLADRAPSPAALDRAVALVVPLLLPAVRAMAGVELRDDVARWLAADLDAPGRHDLLARWRRLALDRTGTIVARPIDAWASPHIVAFSVLPGLPLLELVTPAAEGDADLLDAHDLDRPVAARRLIEAALEQLLVFGAIPVEARLDDLAILPGNRIARIDVGPVEPLSAALRDAIAPIMRAAVDRDTSRITARLIALLAPRDTADPQALSDRTDRLLRRVGSDTPLVLLDALFDAIRGSGYAVPVDRVLLARWLATTIDAALAIDRSVDVADAVQRFLFHRELEVAVALPDSVEAARRIVAVVAPLEALPARLDRLLAHAADEHYRLPVEDHRSPADRRLRVAQVRLVAVAIAWMGAALLLLVARDMPGGAARTGLSMLLWGVAAAAAALFVPYWRRAA